MAFLAALYFLTGDNSGLHRLSQFIALGLFPGTVARLLGHQSWKIHRICFALSLVAYMVYNPSLRPGKQDLTMMLANWHLVLAGFALAFLQPFCGALRLQRLFTDSGIEAGFFATLKLCLAGSFFNIFLPGSTGGDIYRVYAIIGKDRKRFGRALASVTLDRFLGMPPLMIMVLVAAIVDYSFAFANARFAKLMNFIIIASVGSIAIMLALWFSRNCFSDSDASGQVGKLGRIHQLLAANLSRPLTLPLTQFYGLASHVAVVMACACFAYALGVDGIPAWRFFFLVPLANAVNAIPGAPGGIGQGEIAMAALFDLAAPGQGNAQIGVVVMLLLRLANIAIGLTGGAFYAMGHVAMKDVQISETARRSETDQCP